MSYGLVCKCGNYREHHVDGEGVCLGAGPKWPCRTGCMRFTERTDESLIDALRKAGRLD